MPDLLVLRDGLVHVRDECLRAGEQSLRVPFGEKGNTCTLELPTTYCPGRNRGGDS